MRDTVRPARSLLVAAVVLVLAGCTGDAAEPRATAESVATSPAPSATSPAPSAASPATVATLPDDVEAVMPGPLHASVDDWPTGTVVIDPGSGSEDLLVGVRIAATSERRQHGLMEVPVVPDGTGMWFAYDQDHTGAFWMKGTRTDLDIAWVDASGHIVAVETMQVCSSDPCPTYDPEATYRTALEVPAGWLAANEVEVGDTAALVPTAP